MSLTENNNLIYDIELDGNSLRSGQPTKIKKLLKPHQLACLYKATYMENVGSIKYKNRDVSLINNPYTIKISTNIGIIGDIVGYGKTLTALSIIAHNPLDNIHINTAKVHSFHSAKAYNYFTAETENLSLPNLDNMINSTLIIVPRGPVYVQWEKTLKESTDLKYIAIEDLNFIKKNLPATNKNNERQIIDYFNQFDVVLIKNTTLDRLLDYYVCYPLSGTKHFIYNWKRIMIDECHDIINKIEIFNYLFIWLISGTYFNMCNKISSSSYSQYYNIKDILREDYINYILVKCNKDFVRESFKIPSIIEYYHLCKMSKYLKIIKKYINSSILDKINANDISGAIKDLGGKNETEEGIAALICADMNKNLSNKQKEREYISGLDILEENKANRLKTIDNEITIIEGKIKDLTERITEINSKICSICLDNVSQPIILECTHIFCGGCLFKFLNAHSSHSSINKKCPDCRAEIKSTEDLTAIVSIKNDIKNEIIPVCENTNRIGKGILNKEDTLLEIIKNKPEGKFIVFSRVDVFTNIIKLLVSNGITFAELKGNTSHMMNVLKDFKNGIINVILLTTQYAGYGIDINYATDVIIFHSMAVDKQQAIGRAQRVGRTNNLIVHNLCFEHELEENNQSPAI
jgi:SNF2 family DNA or RNA helicase|uniref:RING-type domain-containing protein n=1 Tax=viral metagenome TaxID=1070528 RepID=A0A6C0LCE8_9ZZZZ